MLLLEPICAQFAVDLFKNYAKTARTGDVTANIATYPALDRVIVFSDLDGTLLDHDTYRHDLAKPALDRLKTAGIPLVLASSKTAAEMLPLRAELGFDHCPLICENGAGIIPGGTREAPDDDVYAKLRAKLERVPENLRELFEGFGDMSTERLADVTGLDPEACQRAAARQFSEPGIWHGSNTMQDLFLAALALAGVQARRGGRFLTLSFGFNKVDQMARILADWNRDTVIALGDAPNDAEMLKAADYAVIIPNDQGNAMPQLKAADTPRIIRADRPGPAGWNASINELLDALERGEEKGTNGG